MHKYNNQDHSMYTAMLTVENILGATHDVWAVNVEEEYHESGSTGRDAPVLPRRTAGRGKLTRRWLRHARPRCVTCGHPPNRTQMISLCFGN